MAIQGVGNVGYHLATLLHRAGCLLWVSDLFEQQLIRVAEEFDATVVEPTAIIDQDVDVFAPCAMGAVINAESVKRLRASIVAGAANNQLINEDHGIRLHQRGILYAPDYVINAGGVIAVWYEYSGSNVSALAAQVDVIYVTLLEIFEQAGVEQKPTNSIANQIALSRIHAKRHTSPLMWVAS